MPKFSVIENVPGMANLKITSQKTPKKIKDEADRVWNFIDKYKGVKADLTKKSKSFTKKELSIIDEMKKKKKELEEFILSTSISVLDDIEERYEQLGYDLYKEKLKAHHFEPQQLEKD